MNFLVFNNMQAEGPITYGFQTPRWVPWAEPILKITQYVTIISMKVKLIRVSGQTHR